MNATQIIPVAAIVAVVAIVSVVLFRRTHSIRIDNKGVADGMVTPETVADSVLGQCEFDGIGAYNCTRIVATPHSDTTNLAAHFWLYGDAPTDLQKFAFARLVDNYDDLWPRVAGELAALHPDLATPDEVKIHLRDRVAVHIGEHEEDSVELVYEFDLPNEGIRGFFLRIDGINVTEAVIAE